MTGKVIIYLLSLYAAHIACNEIVKPHTVIILADDMVSRDQQKDYQLLAANLALPGSGFIGTKVDEGYNDVSIHGSDQIPTPNIDMLGYSGVILENYYSDPYGTPTASALFTGKYPMKMGTQGPSIGVAEDRGVPISEQLLPSYLKDLGYVTHFVGKWSLGSSRHCYLPQKRGFDSFYGFMSPVDYYTYNHFETYNGTDFYGLGLYNNLTPVLNQSGHLTNVLTDHAISIIEEHDTSSPLYLHVAHAAAHVGGALVNLQAPGEDLAANSHIPHSARRLYAGLITSMDRSIGHIINALATKDMLNNTLIIFASENGASTVGVSRNYGSNFPLRGTKGTPWEGAVRSTAFVWHSKMESKICNGLFHVTDWLPTILAAAGGTIPEGLDGINQWNSIARDETPKRNDVIIAIDDVNKWGAFRKGDLKIIIGSVPNTCGYYGQDLSNVMHKAPDYKEKLLSSETFRVFTEYLKIGFDLSYALEKRKLCNLNKRQLKSNDTSREALELCIPTIEKGCLYNITADPQESHDLWNEYPEIVQPMTFHFRLRWSEVIPRAAPSFDLRADPSKNDYVWFPWLKDDDEWPAAIQEKSDFPFIITGQELRYYLHVNAAVLEEKLSNYIDGVSNTFVNSVDSLFWN